MSHAALKKYWKVKNCKKKKIYANVVEALHGFVDVASNGDIIPALHVYQCDVCGKFHLGTYRAQNVKKKINEKRNSWIIWELIQKRKENANTTR